MVTMKRKEYYESYARINLGLHFGMELESMKLRDKPDIQNKKQDFGIEVTRDVSELQEKQTSFIISIHEKPADEIPTSKLDRFVSSGGKYTVDGNYFKMFSTATISNSPEHLINSIKTKIVKLNAEDFQKFKTNCLYVFVETVDLFESYVVSVINETSQKDGFDYLFLDGYFEMCICNIRKGDFTRHPITKEMRNNIIKNIALK